MASDTRLYLSMRCVPVHGRLLDVPQYAATAVHVNDEGSGYVIRDNAIWVGDAGGICVRSEAPPLHVDHNDCRESGGVAPQVLFTDPGAGDLTVAPGSPLIGYGSPTDYSLTAMSNAWSATDGGTSR